MSLVWGLRSIHSDDAEMEERAAILLRQLEEDKAQVVVPSIVLAELLTDMDEEKHSEFIATMSGQFFIAPFDVRAASLSAQLYMRHRNLRKKKAKNDRKIFRTDTLIIASAKTAGARVFFSNDKRSRKIASSVMEARDLPTHDENLFINAGL